jgi:hypothetical protein
MTPREVIDREITRGLTCIDFRKPLGRRLRALTGLSAKSLRTMVTEIVRERMLKILGRTILWWWSRYQKKEKGIVWFDKSLSENPTELISMDLIEEIPSPFFISITEAQSKRYTFDVRNFGFLKAQGFVNPYNRKPLTPSSVETMRKRVTHLISRGYQMDGVFERHVPRSPQEKMRLRAIDIFHAMDELGNYTNTSWFFSLTPSQLKLWYKNAEDIWNYRCELSLSRKMEINQQMNSFRLKVVDVYSMVDTMQLQNVVLDEIEKLVNNGINKSERSLGAMYVLTAFAELLPEVALCYPWLIS